MAGRGDEVEHGVDTVVPETGVTLNARLLGENIIVLPFEVANNLGEAGLVIDLVTEARCVDDGKGNARPLFIQLKLCSIRQLDDCQSNREFLIRMRSVPTVTGLILTPSSTWAVAGSSESLWVRTSFPQRVLTKVVRPRKICDGQSLIKAQRDKLVGGFGKLTSS